MSDWRIRLQPPLVLRNSLPVGAQYVVWERRHAPSCSSAGMGSSVSGGSGGQSSVLRACSWGRMDAWGTADVYTVDMRHKVG